jgi:hypothetical protein
MSVNSSSDVFLSHSTVFFTCRTNFKIWCRRHFFPSEGHHVTDFYRH